jgi:hypothetical protein
MTSRALSGGSRAGAWAVSNAEQAQGLTDWERVRAMTEKEIEAAAASDADNPRGPGRSSGARARRAGGLRKQAGDLGACR